MDAVTTPAGEDLPFRGLAEALPTPCWISDEVGDIIWANRAWVAYTGMTPEDIAAHGLERLHDPEVLPKVRERWAQCLKTGVGDEMVFPLKGVDGRLRPFLTRVVPLRDRRGKIVRWFGTNTDVSAFDDTARKLRTSEEQLREVFERAGDGLFIAASDGRYLDANPAACALLGYSREELLKLAVADIIDPAEAERAASIRERAHDAAITGDWKLKRKDGTWIDVQVSARVLSDGRHLAIARDVSEHRRQEGELRAAAQRFRELADQAPVMIWEIGDAGQATWRNAALNRFLGADADEPMNPEVWLHPRDRPRARERFRRAVQGGQPLEIELRLRRHDGEYRRVRTRAAPQRDEHGRVTAYVGTAVDVTEVRRAAELMRRRNRDLAVRADAAERDMKTFWDASRDLLAMVSSKDAIPRMVNERAWRATLGYPAKTILATNLFEFIHPDDRKRTFELSRTEHGPAGVAGFENRYRHADGHWVWLSWNVVRRGDMSFCIARDVTEEKARAETAERAQRLEALGKLTGGVAHDFNNLLTTILGALDLMQRRPDDRPMRDRLMTAALAAVRRGERLNKQLLSFARREPSGAARTDVAALLSDMKPLLESALGGHITLNWDLDPQVAGAAVDPAQLEAAVLNLVVNARDAMAEGGVVTVRTRRPEPRALKAVGLDPKTGFVAVEVLDTGAGMDADVLAHAFEPFFTTKAVGQGSGLGLSQVYGSARQAGGAVAIESTPGAGTAVRLYLREAEAPQAPAASGPLRPPRSARVLLVEDDALVAVVTETLLADAGYEVLRAADAVEALAALRKGQFEILITDVRMPGAMNGVQLAREATRRDAALKVVLCSGWTAETLGAEVGEAPWPFLPKPFDESQLRRILADLTPAEAAE